MRNWVFAVVVALGAVALAADDARAFGRHRHGCCGGCSGYYGGCYGGCSGCYGGGYGGGVVVSGGCYGGCYGGYTPAYSAPVYSQPAYSQPAYYPAPAPAYYGGGYAAAPS